MIIVFIRRFCQLTIDGDVIKDNHINFCKQIRLKTLRSIWLWYLGTLLIRWIWPVRPARVFD